MARHLITSAIPYINGIKHLGNLVGSQLPADLFARYMRARGHEVLFLCATDEHGTPAELAAAKAGKPVAEYCAEMWKVQDELGRGFRLSFDHFGRSSSPQNHRLTQHFAGRLDEAGLIEEVVEKQVYSNADGRFLPDRYIEGTCPEPGCDYDKARGDQCEVCTRQLEPTELINPRSAISGSTDLEIRETKHLYLKQSQMRAQLSAWIDSKKNWPILTTSIAKKWLNDGDGLQDRGITRDLDWGIPVKRGDADWPGMEGKVFYVWFDAPIEYIACAGEWVDAGKGEDWERWWRTDKGAHDVTYTQFMGKDNVPFHTLSFPATILGSAEPWKLVDYIKSFNYLNYDGGQFSTSQGRGVFIDQALEILPADYWRWWLLSHAPESSDSEFTWENFQASVNKDLADVLGNFVSRVTKFCRSKFGEVVPEGG
ncbi:MAG: methionine--tRNA ligase, partial [Pseudomonadota bacterium]